MELNDIKTLIDYVSEKDVAEVVVEKDGTKIVVRKYAPSEAKAKERTQSDSQKEEVGLKEKDKKEKKDSWKEIRSPMVGTFYRAPSPDSPPYVEVGTEFKKGDVLCLVEAMKLFNEITADEPGIIREILVENASPVEYGQVLFYYEPVEG